MPFKLTLGFIILLAGLASCQKEITAGDPDPLLNDTATLLRMVNTRYNNGVPLDSTSGTIKNAYINGQKRILVTWTMIPPGPDSTFTEFTYNTSNQLTRITRRTTDPLDGIEYDEILWQNDRVWKVRFVYDGIVDKEIELIYTPNGNSFNISKKIYPPAPSDTFYSGGVIQWYNVVKDYLTVNSQFIPELSTQISHHYQREGADNNFPGNSHDTMVTRYTYEGMGNLSAEVSAYSGVDSNVNSSPVPSWHKDTITARYTRSMAENPAVYNIIREVYGDQLIVLSEFLNIGFGWDDLLGDWGQNPFYGSYFSHYKQTMNLKRITSVSWINGIPQGPPIDEIIYQADNTFDSQNRLSNSLLYYDYPDINFKRRIIYP